MEEDEIRLGRIQVGRQASVLFVSDRVRFGEIPERQELRMGKSSLSQYRMSVIW